MPRLQAWEHLNNPEYCGRLNMVQLYDLMLRAGYSRDAAQEAASERGMSRLDAQVQM